MSRTDVPWAIVTDLSPGVSYAMLIRSHNIYGTSEPSPISEDIRMRGSSQNRGYAWSNAEIRANLETVDVRLLGVDVLSSTALNASWSVRHLSHAPYLSPPPPPPLSLSLFLIFFFFFFLSLSFFFSFFSLFLSSLSPSLCLSMHEPHDQYGRTECQTTKPNSVHIADQCNKSKL